LLTKLRGYMTIKFIPAICPNCGGELRVPEDRKIIKCIYCGYDIIMHETKNNFPPPSVENWLKLAEAVMDSNPEEAYGYYKKVLEVEPENWKAWHGKGKAAGRLGTLANPRFPEIKNDFQKAIEYSPVDEKGIIEETTTIELFNLANSYLPTSVKFFVKHSHIVETYFQNLEEFRHYFTVIDYFLDTFPKHPKYGEFIETAIGYCLMVIENIPLKLVNVNTNPEEEFENKLQYYVNKMRKINPEYQP
jgi:DNA-directed RNA polymerase subunit RPC12/RpoP